METVRNDRVFKLFPTAKLTTTEHDVVLHVLEHLDKNQEVSIREIASSCFIKHDYRDPRLEETWIQWISRDGLCPQNAYRRSGPVDHIFE